MRYLLLFLFVITWSFCLGVNAKTYGAKGDGIQDDSPYLNDAISKALLLKEDLFIPTGTYKCDQLNTYSKILGMDQSGAKRIRIYGEAGTRITTSQNLGCLFYISYNCVDVVIENIFFESTHGITTNQTNAIQLLGTGKNEIKNFTIRNCRFEGFSTAISAQGVIGLTIENNIFESPKGHDNAQNSSSPAVFIWLSDNSSGQCYDVKILNNFANGFTGTNVAQLVTQRPMDGFVVGVAYGIKIEGNVTRNLGEEHIALTPATTFPNLNYPSLITGNQFYLTIPLGAKKEGVALISNYGIRADCSNVMISNNDFFDYTLGVLIYPLQFPSLKQHGYKISGNRFYAPENILYHVREAIKIQSSPTNLAYNIVISDNYIDIDGIQMKSSRSVIAIYDCEKVNIKNNNIFSMNIDLNGYLFSGILVERSTEVINEGNVIIIK